MWPLRPHLSGKRVLTFRARGTIIFLIFLKGASQMKYLIDEIYKSVRGLMPRAELCSGADITLEGWIRTNRSSNKIGFIALNDGSCFQNCQIVYEEDKVANYAEIAKLLTGCSVRVSPLNSTPRKSSFWGTATLRIRFRKNATGLNFCARSRTSDREPTHLWRYSRSAR